MDATIETPGNATLNREQRFGQGGRSLPVLDRALTGDRSAMPILLFMDDNIGLLVLSGFGLIAIVGVFAALFAAAVADGRIERAFRDGSHLR
jgi:hypothetical protein